MSAVVDLPPQLNDFLTLPNYGENANVKTLTAIVKATPNITQLTTAQDITVFLPSDSAFAAAVAKYGPSALSNLTEVTNVLKDHVIQGHAIFTGANQTSYTTAAGNSLTVGLGGTSSVTGTVVFFSGYNVANIVEPNIILQNGVAHVSLFPFKRDDDVLTDCDVCVIYRNRSSTKCYSTRLLPLRASGVRQGSTAVS